MSRRIPGRERSSARDVEVANAPQENESAYEEYEDEFRGVMKAAGLPLEKEN